VCPNYTERVWYISFGS